MASRPWHGRRAAHSRLSDLRHRLVGKRLEPNQGRIGLRCPEQDGDEDGCLFLDRVPTKAEAVVIRDRLGIPKKVAMSAEGLARRRAQLAVINPARSIAA